ncbi:hypothetical protein PHMEG_00023994 [Phytophthora megakarya]|uniref:PiggyBac transposable element-derived protein domain-containing protein n=1 Tax=Phytophthora megakarya TaxID=4795 RepID=A0A225VFS3_9STRA|nr:hypothetical protein PHMEG_00023994 [Phytophthora megakarya]
MDIDRVLGAWSHEEWEVEEIETLSPTDTARLYIDRLTSDSGLHLRKRDETQAAYNIHREKRLFGLFVSEKLKAAWRTWTNVKLVERGDAAMPVAEMDAYIGLEMAMSLVPVTDIKDLWSEKTFLGHHDFQATMSRNRFQAIHAVVDSIGRVSKKPRGSWELIAAVDSTAFSKNAKKAHDRRQSKLPRTAYPPPCKLFPRARRWTENRVLHRKTFMAPTIVAAYNIVMNGVDRVDHVRSTNPTRRKEQQLSMSLLTWVLDLSLINAFALIQQIRKEQTAPRTLLEFKRRVCESLTSSQRAVLERKRNSLKRSRSAAAPSNIPAREEIHILTPNSRELSSGKLVCHLCSLQGIKAAKFPFGCTKCEVGFHVGCFAVAHFKHAFHNATPSVAAALQALNDAGNGKPSSKTRKRINNSITSLDKLVLRK